MYFSNIFELKSFGFLRLALASLFEYTHVNNESAYVIVKN